MQTRLITTILLAAGLNTATAELPTGAEMSRLRAGEALVEYTQTEASGGAARVTVLMHAPAEALWEVLLSCERSFEYVDGLRACEVVEGGVERARVRQSVKKSLLLPRLDYVIQFDRRPYVAIDFHKVEGDLRLLEGSWRFAPLADEHAMLVTHEIRVQPSFPVPRWLVRRSIARDVPDMLLCLRALAGGSFGGQQASADRALCPRDSRRE
jgi:ribosome-associated toxin RatA of RatAB toxin-antitoxin module